MSSGWAHLFEVVGIVALEVGRNRLGPRHRGLEEIVGHSGSK